MSFNYWDTHPLIENLPPSQPGFIPGFRSVHGYYFDNNAAIQSFPVNEEYFAHYGTALYVAAKYGDGAVYQLPFYNNGEEPILIDPSKVPAATKENGNPNPPQLHSMAGPFRMDESVYFIKLKDGRYVNAGLVAAYYKRNPESIFPGLADKLIRYQLGLG